MRAACSISTSFARREYNALLLQSDGQEVRYKEKSRFLGQHDLLTSRRNDKNKKGEKQKRMKNQNLVKMFLFSRSI